MEAIASRGVELTDEHLDNLIGNLMTELVKLDEIVVEGDLKLQKRKQVYFGILCDYFICFFVCYINHQFIDYSRKREYRVTLRHLIC